jgi:hypothetical protein
LDRKTYAINLLVPVGVRFRQRCWGATDVEQVNKAFNAVETEEIIPFETTRSNQPSTEFLRDISSRLATIAKDLVRAESYLTAPIEASAELDANRLRRMILTRRARERFFPSEMFADPQWDILLDLTLARLCKKQVMVSSAAIAASVPTTTALRCMKVMLDNRIIERVRDPIDRRRSYVQVSDDAFVRMIAFLRSTAPYYLMKR